MSIAPGGYPAAPPPPPRSSSKNLLTIVGIGCGGLFLLALIGGILAVRSVKQQMAHPQKNSVIGIAVTAGKAGMDGVLIQQAVVAYHQQHGHYPQTLMDLVSAGTLDGKRLHNDLDDSPDPGHISWRYTRPAEGAPGATPILEEPYHITMGGGAQPGNIAIDLDGRSQSNTSSPSSSSP